VTACDAGERPKELGKCSSECVTAEFVSALFSDGENTLDNVFKILWPKYMMYFLYFNNKIQNTLFAENYYIIQTSRTNESQISHIKMFDQLFSSCC